MATSTTGIIARVVWRGLSPIRATIHRQGCSVLNRTPAFGHYAKHYDVTAEYVIERAAGNQPYNLCSRCGTRDLVPATLAG